MFKLRFFSNYKNVLVYQGRNWNCYTCLGIFGWKIFLLNDTLDGPKFSNSSVNTDFYLYSRSVLSITTGLISSTSFRIHSFTLVKPPSKKSKSTDPWWEAWWSENHEKSIKDYLSWYSGISSSVTTILISSIKFSAESKIFLIFNFNKNLFTMIRGSEFRLTKVSKECS